MRAITVRAVLSDGEASDGDRLDPVLLATKYRDLYNRPPLSDVVERIELRVNNILLPPPTVEDGWLVFEAQPAWLAHGGKPGRRVGQPARRDRRAAHVGEAGDPRRVSVGGRDPTGRV